MKSASLLLLPCIVFLSACNTSPTTVRVNLDQELQQYIGQSASEIKQKLNLTELGYKVRSAPVQTDSHLSYTVLRTMQIPVAQPAMRISSSGGTQAIHAASSYDSIDLKCNIIFNLKDGIAQSLEYSGRAC